jgi:hypothetical protein
VKEILPAWSNQAVEPTAPLRLSFDALLFFTGPFRGHAPLPGAVAHLGRSPAKSVSMMSLFLRSSVVAAAAFVLLSVRALIGGADPSSRRFAVYVLMVFVICVLAPAVIALFGRHREAEWPWSWVIIATSTAVFTLGLLLSAAVKMLA